MFWTVVLCVVWSLTIWLRNKEPVLLPFSEGDSKNYLTYYKRAAVFLAMGKSKSALPDLTRAIELKPDFLAVSSAEDARTCMRCVLSGVLFFISSPCLPTSLFLCISRPGCREGTSCWSRATRRRPGRTLRQWWDFCSDSNSAVLQVFLAWVMHIIKGEIKPPPPPLQLQRAPDHEEAHEQLMKANDLEELQEDAHAAYHQGDYSTTINVLERAIEVRKVHLETTIIQFCSSFNVLNPFLWSHLVVSLS